MKAVIMAGGEGSRLRPLTCDRPKPLVPICNRPVMAYILDLLAEHGFREVLVTVGYRHADIAEAFGSHHRGMPIRYVVEPRPLGTAGSVAALRPQLNDHFLVISGDGLTDVDLERLIRFHRDSRAVATLGLTRVETPLEYGVVMTDRRGRITRFLEKPGWGEVFSDTVNTGIYVLDPAILDGVPSGRLYDFSQNLFPSLLQMDAPLYAMPMDGYWCDVGDPAAYLQANLDLLQGRLRFRPPGREVAPGIWLADGEPLPEDARVDGGALIGRGCRLGPGVRLEGGVILGDGATVAEGALLRRSVLWTAATVGPEATALGAVLCAGASLEAGAGAFEGAVVGPGARVGERATLAPGVRLWPNIRVAAHARLDCTLVQAPEWTGRLLHRGGLGGRLGHELLPETALRAGSAYATVLGGKGPIVVGGDGGAAAGLMKQALACGILAAGRNVLDVGVTASPVTEFTVTSQRASGGLHVRSDDEQVRVAFFDAAGRPVSRAVQRKLEQTCLRQDFQRAAGGAAGSLERLGQAEWLYLETLSERVNVDAIRHAGFRMEVAGELWPVMARWLERLRCGATGRGPNLRIQLDRLEGVWRLPDAGPEADLALEAWLRLRSDSEEPICLPVTAPAVLDDLVTQRRREVRRVRVADWQPADPLLSLAHLLEWMAEEQLTERDLHARLPKAALARRTVPCPWAAKGRVMRRLMEEHAGQPVDLVDGLRVRRPEGWVLLLPDPDDPVYQIQAEAGDETGAHALADAYEQMVRSFV